MSVGASNKTNRDNMSYNSLLVSDTNMVNSDMYLVKLLPDLSIIDNINRIIAQKGVDWLCRNYLNQDFIKRKVYKTPIDFNAKYGSGLTYYRTLIVSTDPIRILYNIDNPSKTVILSDQNADMCLDYEHTLVTPVVIAKSFKYKDNLRLTIILFDIDNELYDFNLLGYRPYDPTDKNSNNKIDKTLLEMVI